MPTAPLTILEFLTLRLAEDEAVARGAGPRHQSDTGMCVHDDDHSYPIHIGAARVLAEVEAKRRIIELHGVTTHSPGGTPACTSCGDHSEYPTDWPCDTIKLEVVPYRDHPDFNENWD